MNILLAIVILGLLILVHEFGHFILAKANGVVVLEFAIGFGPKLLHFKKNDTEYCLKLIPFGGYCLMLGNELIEAAKEDEDDEEEKDSKYKNLLKQYDESRTYNNKPVWARIAIELAGPFFNFILAFVGAIVVIGSVGVDPCRIDVVQENSPASAAGLQVGDEIVSINKDKMSFAREYFFYNSYHEGETMDIVYKRNGEEFKTTVTPEYVTNSSYMLGVVVTNNTLIDSIVENSAAAEAGLKKGDIVINDQGLIGIISHVQENSSEVSLITNKDLNISVKVGESYGILYSKDHKLKIKNMKIAGIIKEGDEVVTSGLTSIPEGIKIGKVTNIEKDELELEYILDIEGISLQNLKYLGVISL